MPTITDWLTTVCKILNFVRINGVHVRACIILVGLCDVPYDENNWCPPCNVYQYISCSLFVNLVYHLLVKQRLSKPISGVGRAHDRKRPTDRPSWPTPFVTINRIYTRATVMRPNKTVGYKMQNTNYKIRYTEMSKMSKMTITLS